MTFQDHATAAYWVAEHSESWFQIQRILLAARSVRG
jgi:hypothetical protein